jgi:hypothetical protein
MRAVICSRSTARMAFMVVFLLFRESRDRGCPNLRRAAAGVNAAP